MKAPNHSTDAVAIDTRLLADVLARLAQKGLRQDTVAILVAHQTGVSLATVRGVLEALLDVEGNFLQ